jgi:hypothetical protein
VEYGLSTYPILAVSENIPLARPAQGNLSQGPKLRRERPEKNFYESQLFLILWLCQSQLENQI